MFVLTLLSRLETFLLRNPVSQFMIHCADCMQFDPFWSGFVTGVVFVSFLITVIGTILYGFPPYHR